MPPLRKNLKYVIIFLEILSDFKIKVVLYSEGANICGKEMTEWMTDK